MLIELKIDARNFLKEFIYIILFCPQNWHLIGKIYMDIDIVIFQFTEKLRNLTNVTVCKLTHGTVPYLWQYADVSYCVGGWQLT
jgi:hypothetical protein